MIIDFETKPTEHGNKSITSCPNHQRMYEGGDWIYEEGVYIKVGSILCKNCKYFKRIYENEKEVECKYQDK